MTLVTAHSAVTPPQPPPPHSQPYGEDGQHLSFDNGPHSRQPGYQPPTPLRYPQPSDCLPQCTWYGEPPYPIQVATAKGKHKAQRASKACDMCRKLKVKCDEFNPCKSCLEKGVECKYREAVPTKHRQMADILDILSELQRKFDAFGQRISQLERTVVRNRSSADAPAQDEDEQPESAESATPAAKDGDSLSPTYGTPGTQAPIDSPEGRAITHCMEEEKEVKPGPVVQPGVPSIPHNHTAIAAFLLKWRPISVLVRGILAAENVKFVDEFPIRQEEERGLLRVWGRGEGLESSPRVDEADKEAIRDAGAIEMVQEDVFDASAAPSPADCWGGISGSPDPIDDKTVIGVQTPDFSESLVWKYVKSFQNNIQNMHPLIIPVELDAMNLGRQSGDDTIAKFDATSKRPRAPESPAVSPKSAKPMFQRSINNALVLLVLALGKILPVTRPPYGSLLARNGYPASPIPASSPSQPSYPHSAGVPLTKEVEQHPGPGSSVRGGSPKRNLDVIPGLDYFAYATDILGGQLAGASLRHIHAYLLAGLYHGQLGRAGYALRVRMSLDRFRKLQQDMHLNQTAVTEKADNQLFFAYWTCLQLESDIIAELPLPQTHILDYADMMPYPNIHVAQQFGFNERVLESCLAQLYLRKRLNDIHGMLYNPEDPQPLPGGNVIEYIQETLDMCFVITYRPFVCQILEHNFQKTMANESPMPASDFHTGVSVPAIGPEAGSTEEVPRQMIEYAVKGVRALIESTRAFHGLKEKRFIITNVFLTAHAQWGNLVTLSAVFRDPTLQGVVEEQVLKELFSRTIAFFRIIAHPTSALHIDLRILEGLERDLWGQPNYGVASDHPTGSSFSSSARGRHSPIPPIAPVPLRPPMPLVVALNQTAAGMQRAHQVE
ncbi:hypothetical protein N658DRAFT_516071 [Parathielavia hyrcaniae]|uniref:Zn(2)-C6 fungal-type domain-containing protein n=1 Tax=Parathielavia hyrcaniae TaxID=113614 RepID=A0AAN6Q3S7_9PEZI|nr:hypothetical protein N658DRAFT_516071 [Parathielavia hyrcaniae]